MNILCLNTAFDKANIALEYEGKTFYKETDSCCKHSENLLLEVEKLFENAKKETENSNDVIKNLDVISVVVGPGSFTGLRISIATAKGLLAVFPNIKCVAINSLELIAYSSAKIEKTAIINGLSGFYFLAQYNDKKETYAPKMISKEELNQFNNFVSIENLPFETEIVDLTPKNLLLITKEKISKNLFVDENNLVPLYLRPSQAEANLNGNKK